MEYKDYYATLGVARDAAPDDIKRAYRKLARETHPDVNEDPAATETFKAASEAFEVLKDPQRRAAYDQLGKDLRHGQGFSPPPDWSGGFAFAEGAHGGGEPEEMSAFFEALFGRRDRTRGFHAEAYGHHARLEIDLKDTYRGARRELAFRTPEIGPDGEVTVRERRIAVDIPKGVAEGEHLRVADPGGDLMLEIAFRPHPVFDVEGRDVTMDLPLTPWEAALGAAVRTPTPAGEVDLNVPAGARPGQRLRMKGKGVPGRPPGDLFARIKIVAPPAETPEGRALYERMAREMPFDPRAGMEV